MTKHLLENGLGVLFMCRLVLQVCDIRTYLLQALLCQNWNRNATEGLLCPSGYRKWYNVDQLRTLPNMPKERLSWGMCFLIFMISLVSSVNEPYRFVIYDSMYLTCFTPFYIWQLDLTLYNPNESLTSARVTCDQKFCADINGGTVGGCSPNVSCLFTETYEDGSGSLGYFIRDVVQYDSVSGDLETKLANGSVIFGYI